MNLSGSLNMGSGMRQLDGVNRLLKRESVMLSVLFTGMFLDMPVYYDCIAEGFSLFCHLTKLDFYWYNPTVGKTIDHKSVKYVGSMIR